MDRNGGPSTREWPLLQEVPDSVFRACYSKMRTEDHYQAFKKQLLVGDVKRYRQLELKMVVRELSRVYKDRLAFSLQACKADLARQIEFLRGEGEDSCRELIRVNIKQSSSILDSPPASQVSEGENFLRRQQARTSDWVLCFF
ncbi:hypothetical protein DIPPA_00589 [Diplonema papillatum]|nr:hypothetical protein DIPPA_00589 [Diplonema papillatum]